MKGRHGSEREKEITRGSERDREREGQKEGERQKAKMSTECVGKAFTSKNVTGKSLELSTHQNIYEP